MKRISVFILVLTSLFVSLTAEEYKPKLIKLIKSDYNLQESLISDSYLNPPGPKCFRIYEDHIIVCDNYKSRIATDNIGMRETE